MPTTTSHGRQKRQLERQEWFLDRPLPSSEESERVILGAIFLDNSLISSPIEELSDLDFYSPIHRRTFAAFRRLFEKGSPIDPILTLEEMKKDGPIDSIGGVGTITNFTYGLPHFDTLEPYIRAVKAKSMARAIVHAATRCINSALDDTLEIDDLVDYCENELYGVSQIGERSEFNPINSLVFTSLERSYQARDSDSPSLGLSTGFSELDNLTLGLTRQDLTILAGRPSMGKTALGLNIAQNAAFRSNAVVAFFSLEMSKEAVSERIICAEANINSHHFRQGNLNQDEWQRVTEFQSRMPQNTLFIDDTPAITPTYIRAKLRRLFHEQRRLDLVVVDYLQLMTGRTQESREREVAQISRDLKSIAKEFNVPVLALAQLNRQAEQRSTHLPMLSDLRESGGIEQDADMVWFVFREDYYRKSIDHDNLANIIVAKQRNGPTGTINLNFYADTTSFTNLRPADF